MFSSFMREHPEEGAPRGGGTQGVGSPQQSRHKAFPSCLLCFCVRPHHSLLSPVTWSQLLDSGNGRPYLGWNTRPKLGCRVTVSHELAGRTLDIHALSELGGVTKLRTVRIVLQCMTLKKSRDCACSTMWVGTGEAVADSDIW